jgi:hypothetical protein
MTDAPQVSEAPASNASMPAPAGNEPISPREAASALSRWRHARSKEPEQVSQEPTESAPEAAPVEPAQELADEANAAPPATEAPGETQEAEPTAELSPIEPPRSWTKEEKEEFASYPREAQEKIARREQDRERAFRQRQNEVAEKQKAIDAESEKVTQARQQYEQALPVLLNYLQSSYAGEFADIKTMADVQRLSVEDPMRYTRWDAHQKQIAAVQQEVQASEQRKEVEKKTKWTDFAKQQDQLIAEKIPELADKEKAQKISSAAIDVLGELGFDNEELAGLWNGDKEISLRDHRLQQLIFDGVKYREAKKAVKTAPAKPVPPVQRPGVAAPKGAADEHKLQTLKSRLDQTGSVKDAAAYQAAKRAAARR